MRTPKGSGMVGEHQGEHQFPPESARKGRRCKLIPMTAQEAAPQIGENVRYDNTAECLVVYLD